MGQFTPEAITKAIHPFIFPFILFGVPMASLIPIILPNTYVLCTSQWYLYTRPVVHHSVALV